MRTYDVYHPRLAKWRVGRFLRSRKFDLLVNFDVDLGIYGFLRHYGQFSSVRRMVKHHVEDDTYQQLQVAVGECPHIAAQYVQLVTGVVPDAVSYVVPNLSEALRKKATLFRRKWLGRSHSFVVGIHPGNHSQDTNTLFQKKQFDTRSWTKEATLVYASRIAAAFPGTVFVLTGGWYERKLTRPLLKAFREKGLAVVDVSGKTKKLQDLMALLLSLDMYVSGDTGPMHIAASLGVSQVGLFFSTNVRDTGPLGYPERSCKVVSPIPCAPCLHTAHERQCPPNTNCVQQLDGDYAFNQSYSFIQQLYESVCV